MANVRIAKLRKYCVLGLLTFLKNKNIDRSYIFSTTHKVLNYYLDVYVSGHLNVPQPCRLA